MLSWQHIYKKFADKIVADDLSLDVNDGEVVAILGESGSGKSTLLNIAAGLINPDAGSVWVGEDDISLLSPERRCLGMMFQDYALLPHLNTWQNVAFGLRMHGENKRNARQRAMALLAEVGLEDVAQQSVNALSGGERQRVALARALILQPRGLLLDEPFSALDTNLRTSLQQLTLRMLQQQNCPTVLVTHSPQEAFAMANWICLLNHGCWIQQGTVAELLECPVSAWAARLLGCDNVSDSRYIPQSALQYGGERGESVMVCAVNLTAKGYEVQLQHSRYGMLCWWLPLSFPVNIGDKLPLTVHEEKIVYFV